MLLKISLNAQIIHDKNINVKSISNKLKYEYMYQDITEKNTPKTCFIYFHVRTRKCITMVAADHTNYNVPSSSVMKVWPFFFCSSANFFSLRRLCYKSVYSALIYNSPLTSLIWTIHVCIPLNHVPL